MTQPAPIDFATLHEHLRQGYCVLVPNQRARDFLLTSYAASQQQNCWHTPDVNAIDIWISRLWQQLGSRGIAPFATQRLLSSNEEAFLWLDLIEQSQSANPLLNVSEAAASAQRAYRLFRLWLDDGSDPACLPPPAGISELQTFRDWVQRFTDRCRSDHLLSLADATHMLVRELQAGRVTLPQPMILLNFYQPPPLYATLFRLLADSGAGSLRTTVDPAPDSVPGGLLHRFDDFESECRACAAWAATRLREQPGQRIGIIFEGNDSKRKLLERCFLDTFSPLSLLDPGTRRSPFYGAPAAGSLADHGLIEEALLLLGLGDDSQDSLDFCRLLQSPGLLHWDEEQDQRIALEDFLRDNVTSRCSLSQLLALMSRDHKPYHCPRLAGALLHIRNTVRQVRGRQDAAWWKDFFNRQLEALGWPAHPGLEKPSTADLLRQWHRALDEFAAMSALLGAMDRSTALARLRILCQALGAGPSFDPARQVSLLNLREAAGLHFDHLWLLDCSDQAQPPAPQPSPFLLLSAQRQARIPGSHSEIELDNARVAFRILCRATDGEIHASFHRQEGDEQLRPSSLLTAFKDAPPDAAGRQFLNSLALADSSAAGNLVPVMEQPVPLLEPLHAAGGQAVLSDQSSCPFRAFASHRLGAGAQESFSNGLSARARGTALHIALEALFSGHSDHRQLQALSASARQALLDQSVQEALGFLHARFPELMTPRFSSIESDRIRRLLDAYLELELQRPGFQVVATEAAVSWQYQQLAIRLKVDRLDRLPGGALAVIDYKTGKTVPSVKRLLEPRPENLQLPLYQLAVSADRQEPVEAVVFAQLNVSRLAYAGLSAGSEFHDSLQPVTELREFNTDWSRLTDDWQVRLEQLAAEFNQGVARVDPVNGAATCTYCHLQSLCRIQALQPQPAAQDAAGEEDGQ